jgi:hypothetical protein
MIDMLLLLFAAFCLGTAFGWVVGFLLGLRRARQAFEVERAIMQGLLTSRMASIAHHEFSKMSEQVYADLKKHTDESG